MSSPNGKPLSERLSDHRLRDSHPQEYTLAATDAVIYRSRTDSPRRRRSYSRERVDKRRERRDHDDRKRSSRSRERHRSDRIDKRSRSRERSHRDRDRDRDRRRERDERDGRHREKDRERDRDRDRDRDDRRDRRRKREDDPDIIEEDRYKRKRNEKDLDVGATGVLSLNDDAMFVSRSDRRDRSHDSERRQSDRHSRRSRDDHDDIIPRRRDDREPRKDSPRVLDHRMERDRPEHSKVVVDVEPDFVPSPKRPAPLTPPIRCVSNASLPHPYPDGSPQASSISTIRASARLGRRTA